MTQTKNVAIKLVNIMESLSGVPKKGFNNHQKYYYTREVDVLEALKKELIEKKIILLTSATLKDIQKTERDNKLSFLTTVETTHTFIDSESGEQLTVTSVGSGYDNTDKGAAKAITSAIKYALTKTFMISDEGSDIENDGETVMNKTAPKAIKSGATKLKTPTINPQAKDPTEAKTETKTPAPVEPPKKLFKAKKFVTANEPKF